MELRQLSSARQRRFSALKNVSCRFHDAADAIADSARRCQNSPEGDPMNARLRTFPSRLDTEPRR